MNILKYAREKANFRSCMLGAGTVMAGTAAAEIRGDMELLSASICLLYVLVTQVWANFYHASWVVKRQGFREPMARIDDGEKHVDPIKLRIIREGMGASFMISLMLGFSLMWMVENMAVALVFGALIYGLNVVINYGPRPIYGTVWSLLVTFLLFGPIGVIGVSMVEQWRDATVGFPGYYLMEPALYAGISMGLMAMTIFLSYSYMNFRVNPHVNPRSVTRAMGPKLTEWVIFLCGFLSFGVFVFAAIYLGFSRPILSTLPGFIGFALNTYIAATLRNSSVAELHHHCTLTYVNFMLTGFTLLVIWAAV